MTTIDFTPGQSVAVYTNNHGDIYRRIRTVKLVTPKRVPVRRLAEHLGAS